MPSWSPPIQISPVGLAFLSPAYRVGVGARHDLVDLCAQPAPAHRRPARHVDRQLPIHARQHLAVGDQIAAIHQGLKRAVVDVAGFEQLPHPGQPLAHGPGVAQPAGGQPLADPQLRTHLGGHRLLSVHSPVFGVRAAREPIGEQRPDRVQLRGRGPVLGARRPADRLQQGRRLRRRGGMAPLELLIKAGDHLPPRLIIEHVFEYMRDVRHIDCDVSGHG